MKLWMQQMFSNKYESGRFQKCFYQILRLKCCSHGMLLAYHIKFQNLLESCWRNCRDKAVKFIITIQGNLQQNGGWSINSVIATLGSILDFHLIRCQQILSCKSAKLQAPSTAGLINSPSQLVAIPKVSLLWCLEEICSSLQSLILSLWSSPQF